MLLEATINLWAVLVSTAASMFIGYVWYSKALFANSWAALIGKTEEDLKKGAGPAMGIAVLLALVTSYVFAHIIDYVGAKTVMEGLVTGIWLWLGFVFTTIAMQNIFAGRPWKLTMINVGYHFVQFMVLGAVLASWK